MIEGRFRPSPYSGMTQGNGRTRLGETPRDLTTSDDGLKEPSQVQGL